MLQKACFCHWKHPFWGFFRVFLQDFTKIQNLISLNISVLQSKLCVFVFLQICICETASVRQLKQASLRSLTRSFDDVPSSKELTLGLPQINLGILSLNRSFVFLCFCVLHFAMRNCSRSAIETSFIALTYSHLCKCEPALVRRITVLSLPSL